ncbi:MAG: hypothetical protein EA384_11345 [Spirochaetaceae bacterium]|nr:MAG: hypothetical protein EA384_11345 [Spirochaetaceae bacterium]
MVRTLCTTLLAILLVVTTAAAADRDDNNWDDWDEDGGWESDNGNGWGATTAQPGVDLSGYLETTGVTVLPRNARGGDTQVGLQTVLRLRGRFEPEPFLSATVETEFLDRRGAATPAGAETRQIYFDYLYGSVAFGPLDLRVGRQPLAWGTAYAFNPTDLMNPSTMAGLAGVEPPGITAISSSLTVGDRLGLEGYLGFEDRSRHATALADLSGADRLPWGVRGRAFVGMWDFGLGLARSAEYDPRTDQDDAVRTADYAVTEVSGSIGPVLLYGETAIEVGTGDWQLKRSLDAAVGARWDPLDRVSLQAEYHRRGRGAADPADYLPADLLARRLVARDYVVGIGTLSMMDDNLRLMVSSLVNLNDRSSAVLPELSWRITDDFQTALGASIFLGSKQSEFDGRLSDEDLGEVDLGRPQLFLRATWYF